MMSVFCIIFNVGALPIVSWISAPTFYFFYSKMPRIKFKKNRGFFLWITSLFIIYWPVKSLYYVNVYRE
jgi:hypothetical protein